MQIYYPKILPYTTEHVNLAEKQVAVKKKKDWDGDPVLGELLEILLLEDLQNHYPTVIDNVEEETNEYWWDLRVVMSLNFSIDAKATRGKSFTFSKYADWKKHTTNHENLQYVFYRDHEDKKYFSLIGSISSNDAIKLARNSIHNDGFFVYDYDVKKFEGSKNEQ